MKSQKWIFWLFAALIAVVAMPTSLSMAQDDTEATPCPSCITSTPISILASGTNQITINQTIDDDIVARTVYIKTPQNLDNEQSYPVVFAFHGAGGSANQFLNNPSLNQLIDSGEFIGIYPNGHSDDGSTGGYWNLGSEPTTADDIEFVDLIMQQLATYTELDTSRVYAIGFSNGAGLVNLLGKSTSHFNAIAPLFSQQSISTGDIIASNALSVFQINGDIDRIIPVNGGESVVGAFMSAQDSALNWVNAFNCETRAFEENITWGNISLDSYSYSNCDSDHEVRYMIAQDTGHGWNDRQADTMSFTEIWLFFQQH